jgi:hypothetical protein
VDPNVLAFALANKLAHTPWAVLKGHGFVYVMTDAIASRPA